MNHTMIDRIRELLASTLTDEEIKDELLTVSVLQGSKEDRMEVLKNALLQRMYEIDSQERLNGMANFIQLEDYYD